MSKITFLAHNASDHTLTFAIDGKRYEYVMPTAAVCDTVLYMVRKVSVAKGFAYAKRRGMLLEPAQSSRPSTQREADEERSGAYR